MSRCRSRASTRFAMGLALSCLLAPVASGEAAREGLSLQVIDGSGAPVQGAVASLHGATSVDQAAPNASREEVVIEQTRGQFSPALTVVDVGTAVRFPNLDRIRHHVYSFSPAKPFELPLYSGEAHEPVVFDAPGIVTLGCNIHDWMLAHVLVMDTPWRALSGPDGRVHLAPPPGDYQLRVWHADLPAGQGVVEQPVVVDGGVQSLQLELDLSRPPLRRQQAVPSSAGEYE